MKNSNSRICLLMTACLAMTATPQIVCAAVDANTAGAEWRWSPYSVGLCLVVDDSVADSAEIERDTMAALMRWQSNWLNGICDFHPESWESGKVGKWESEKNEENEKNTFPPPTFPSFHPSPFPPSWEQHDKLFLIAVTHRDVYLAGDATVGWSATICELDVRTRNIGECRQVEVTNLSQLPEHLFCGITEMLTPLARVVRVDENRILLEERAGELLALQDVLPVVAPQQVMLPVTRTNDRDGNPQQIHRVDWTYLTVDRNSDGLLSTTMHTGLRSPINARLRPRHQQLALLAKPTHNSKTAQNTAPFPAHCETTIRFTSYITPEMPLPVCDILESVPGRSVVLPEYQRAILIGSTDSRGEFRIDFKPERPVRLLYVRNGKNLIARIPIMPGVEPELVAEVPTADATLYAESIVLGIQEEILDTVAMRQILVSQAITFRQRSDRKGFDDTIMKLRRLKTQQVYQAELNLLKMQLPYDDPSSRRRIEAMLEQTRTLVQDLLLPVEVPWTTR